MQTNNAARIKRHKQLNFEKIIFVKKNAGDITLCKTSNLLLVTSGFNTRRAAI
jgi:hypothetical protein